MSTEQPKGPPPEKRPPPDYNQYGLKDENVQAADVYANRPGGETPVVGPADAVDASGHRQGAMEERPLRKPSSRAGRDVIGETDDRRR